MQSGRKAVIRNQNSLEGLSALINTATIKTKEEILIKALLKKWHLIQNQPLLVQILQNHLLLLIRKESPLIRIFPLEPNYKGFTSDMVSRR